MADGENRVMVLIGLLGKLELSERLWQVSARPVVVFFSCNCYLFGKIFFQNYEGVAQSRQSACRQFVSLDEMVQEMVAVDLADAKKHALLKKHGYNVNVSAE
jgi:hypothetical protein